MRVVLDTNVLVSGLLSAAGPPARVLEMLLGGRLELLADGRIMQEYADVLARPELGIEPSEAAAVLEALAGEMEPTAAGEVRVELPDADDEKFLAVALAGRADALITGSKRHFPAPARRGAAVLSPREILARADKQK